MKMVDTKFMMISSNVNPLQSHFQRVCDQTNVIIPSHSNRLKQNPLSNKISFENILKNWLPAAPFWTNLAMGNISYVASLCAIKCNNAIQVEIYSGDLTRYINGDARNPEVSPVLTRIRYATVSSWSILCCIHASFCNM